MNATTTYVHDDATARALYLITREHTFAVTCDDCATLLMSVHTGVIMVIRPHVSTPDYTGCMACVGRD